MSTIETPANVIPHPNAPQEYMSVAETAKLVRGALKAAFPRVTFSVKSKSYSGGASITVRWFDGPTTRDVEAIADQYSGADFDGMIDLKTYHATTYQGRRVHFGADFIFCERSVTPAFMRAVAEQVCSKYGLDVPMIAASEYSGAAYIPREHDARLPDNLRGGMNDSVGDLVNKAVAQAREHII